MVGQLSARLRWWFIRNSHIYIYSSVFYLQKATKVLINEFSSAATLRISFFFFFLKTHIWLNSSSLVCSQLWTLPVVFRRRALTEKIVSVLPKMKCPHRLEPHQIQGLDFIHIFPVVQVRQTAGRTNVPLLRADVSLRGRWNWTDQHLIYCRPLQQGEGVGHRQLKDTKMVIICVKCIYYYK